MKLNFSALNNMTPPVFNTTGITTSEDAINTLITSSNEVSGGYFGLAVMIVIFLVLVFAIFRQDGDIRLNIARSLLISSGFTSIIGIVMLATPLISSFIHVMWFMTIFLIMVIVVYNLKRKGL